MEYLDDKKIVHSKGKNIEYDQLEKQPYITDASFSSEEKQILFKLRTRMVEVKENFKSRHSDTICSLCFDHVESQKYLLDCPVLINNCSDLYNDSFVKYEDLFSSEIEKQLKATKLFDAVLETRNKLLEIQIELGMYIVVVTTVHILR